MILNSKQSAKKYLGPYTQQGVFFCVGQELKGGMSRVIPIEGDSTLLPPC